MMTVDEAIEVNELTFPRACPQCGQEDYGLNVLMHGGCLQCDYPHSISTVGVLNLLSSPVVDTVTSFCGAPKNKEEDEVDHPPHYTSHPSGVECIQITEHMNFNLGNAMKYLWRAGLKGKDATKDLKKAAWYIEREVARIKSTDNSTEEK